MRLPPFLLLVSLFSLGCAVVEADGDCDNGIDDDDDGRVDCDDESCGFSALCSDCGDGVVGPGESCDDGNNDDGDGCDFRCADESCGDGIKDEGEACDDGNDDGGDGCDHCRLGTCGDSVLQPGEGCEDGGNEDGDGCDSECVGEYSSCDPQLVPLLQCIDGNVISGDGCSASCRSEFCGDGIVQPSRGERCDDQAPGAQAIGCIGCLIPVCGNGLVEGREQCDDGNVIDNDGCTSDCRR